MTRFIGFAVALVMLCTPARLLFAQASAPQAGSQPADKAAASRKTSQDKPARKLKPSAAQIAEIEEDEPQLLPALPLDESPAQPPTVSFAGGVLNVDSRNATLSDVLNAIRRVTALQIEMVPGLDSERVAAHLSGAPDRVIAALLDGSKFGYVILASLEDPTKLEKLVLTRQSSSPGAPSAMASAHRGPFANRPAAEPAPAPAPEPAPPAPVASVPAPEQSPAPVAQASLPNADSHPVFNGDPSTIDRSAQPKPKPDQSPQDFLQDLYKLRQQQVQQLTQGQKPQ